MKLLIPILFICLSSCCACDEPYIENNNLSDAEVDAVIMEGYADYLDSIDRVKYLYHRFSEMRDTSLVSDLIYREEGKIEDLPLKHFIVTGNEPYAVPYNYSNQIISHYHLNGITFANQEMHDSILENNWSLFSDDDTLKKATTLYSISKPFRPDTSEMVVIQEYPMIIYGSCFPVVAKNLIFKKINGHWKFHCRY